MRVMCRVWRRESCFWLFWLVSGKKICSILTLPSGTDLVVGRPFCTPPCGTECRPPSWCLAQASRSGLVPAWQLRWERRPNCPRRYMRQALSGPLAGTSDSRQWWPEATSPSALLPAGLAGLALPRGPCSEPYGGRAAVQTHPSPATLAAISTFFSPKSLAVARLTPVTPCGLAQRRYCRRSLPRAFSKDAQRSYSNHGLWITVLCRNPFMLLFADESTFVFALLERYKQLRPCRAADRRPSSVYISDLLYRMVWQSFCFVIRACTARVSSLHPSARAGDAEQRETLEVLSPPSFLPLGAQSHAPVFISRRPMSANSPYRAQAPRCPGLS